MAENTQEHIAHDIKAGRFLKRSSTELFIAEKRVAALTADNERLAKERDEANDQLGRVILNCPPDMRTAPISEQVRNLRRRVDSLQNDKDKAAEWLATALTRAEAAEAELAKQQKNMARTWPDWRTMSESSAIEHDRSKDVSLAKQEKADG